jgi:hypothetical protein
MINLQYNITDKENDPITTSYTINGGEKVSTEKSVNKQLKLTNGDYKILIEYADPTHALKDSIRFTVNSPTGIEPVTLDDKVTLYPNPTRDYLYIKHEAEAPKTIYREIYDINGRLMDHDKIEIGIGETIEKINTSKYPNGIYIITFTNATKKQRLEFTKE